VSFVEVELVPASPPGEPGGTAVAVVTLNDPDRRNMLSAPMVDGIVEAFDRIESAADPVVGAVVVTGAGRAFCAGADLGGLAQASSAAAPDDPSPLDGQGRSLGAIYEGFLRVARCPLPTVAAVNGPAVGAGMNLAMACDVRVVGERGRFECRFSELGLHPGGGHTWLLSRLVGPEAAAAMVLFGEVLPGDEAVARGLAWQSVPDDELRGAAVALAARAAACPPALMRRIKQSLGRAAAAAGHEAAVEYELEAQLWSLGQPFFAERLAALRNRISSSPKPGIPNSPNSPNARNA
jgi:enoyl-CoA hydratase